MSQSQGKDTTGDARAKDHPEDFSAKEKQESQPGLEHEMSPAPQYISNDWVGSGKLKDKVAIITGGDSGIGRAVAVLFAREGCDVVISYVDKEQKDAEAVKQAVEKEGRKCVLVPGDIRKKDTCKHIVDECLKELKKVDILVNNAAVQYPVDCVTEITEEKLRETFEVNIFSFFYLTQFCVPHMKEGSSIINTTSVNSFKGHQTLLDYTTTKGAITSFTRALSGHLLDKKIRVNAVAPGPIWTPLIVSSFTADHIKEFGKNCPMERAGQPEEVAPAYLFLACNLMSSYITGQTVHPNGGYVVNS